MNKDPSAEATFKEIAEAYDVLSDPATRKKYDAFGSDRRVPDDLDPDIYRRACARDAGSAGPNVDFGGAEFDFNDIFSDFFGRTAQTGAARRGPIAGLTRKRRSSSPSRMPTAAGALVHDLGAERAATIEVTILPGVIDGQRIRLAGQGGQGTSGAPAGDPLPGRADRAAPPVPGRRAGHHGRAAAHPVGGGARRARRGRHTGRRSQGAGAGGDLDRQAPAPQGSRHAHPQRHSRGPLRRGADHGARAPDRRRAPAVRGARGCRPSIRGEGDDDRHRRGDTGSGPWTRSRTRAVYTPISSSASSPRCARRQADCGRQAEVGPCSARLSRPAQHDCTPSASTTLRSRSSWI